MDSKQIYHNQNFYNIHRMTRKLIHNNNMPNCMFVNTFFLLKCNLLVLKNIGFLSILTSNGCIIVRAYWLISGLWSSSLIPPNIHRCDCGLLFNRDALVHFRSTIQNLVQLQCVSITEAKHFFKIRIKIYNGLFYNLKITLLIY